MIKKIFIITLLVLVGLGSYYYFRTHKKEESPEGRNIVIRDSNPQKKSSDPLIPSSLKIKDQKLGKTLETDRDPQTAEETADKNFELFDQLEKKWLTRTTQLIGPELSKQYLEMREENEKEKMMAYKAYHDYLRQKYGDKFSYNISEDQSTREKEINNRYLTELLKLIGPDKFKRYTEMKDQFNEEMRRNNKEALQIEF